MKLYAAGGLQRHIQQSALGGFYISIVQGYAAELVSALSALESAGCVHRDVKTANCVLDHLGHIVLCDFGSAKLLTRFTSTTSETSHARESLHSQQANDRCYTLTGTPHAMAPEMVAQNLRVGYDHSADFWSLGVFIYELLTGHIPQWHREEHWPTNADPTAQDQKGQDAVWSDCSAQRVAECALLIHQGQLTAEESKLERKADTSDEDMAPALVNAARGAWSLETVDPLFVAKRGSSHRTAGVEGVGYGMTERERRQYGHGVDLVKALLVPNPHWRLQALQRSGSSGSVPREQRGGAWSDAVRAHSFFAGLDWAAVDAGRSPAPNPDFDRRLGVMELIEEFAEDRDVISEAEQQLFAGF